MRHKGSWSCTQLYLCRLSCVRTLGPLRALDARDWTASFYAARKTARCTQVKWTSGFQGRSFETLCAPLRSSLLLLVVRCKMRKPAESQGYRVWPDGKRPVCGRRRIDLPHAQRAIIAVPRLSPRNMTGRGKCLASTTAGCASAPAFNSPELRARYQRDRPSPFAFSAA